MKVSSIEITVKTCMPGISLESMEHKIIFLSPSKIAIIEKEDGLLGEFVRDCTEDDDLNTVGN